MTENEIKELAKAAAHSAVIGYAASENSVSPHGLVDNFLVLYEYALKKIIEMQPQTQNEVNMEFGSNEVKFR